VLGTEFLDGKITVVVGQHTASSSSFER